MYSLLLTLASFVLLPYFLFQAVVQKKYLRNLRQRFGFELAALTQSVTGQAAVRSTLWVHAVSVGETLAAVPLLKALRARFPGHRLVLTTTTATGQALAQAQLAAGLVDGVCYFPFDWRFAVRRAFKAIRPACVILLESELWPNFLKECQAQAVPVLVANGRISDRSFRRSRNVSWLLAPVYRRVTSWQMQSAADAERAIALGAPPEKVQVSGNLKYDIGQPDQSERWAALATELDALFDLRSAPLIVAGSTTELAGVAEEQLLLKAFTALRQQPGMQNVRLLLAPRHPERFAAVGEMLAQLDYVTARRSLREPAPSAQVILLDSIGELAALYQFATVVFVGGSLIAKGGHNILEPALFAKPIVVGPHMENFRAIANEFLQRAALVQLQATDHDEQIDELRACWQRLLTDQGAAQTLGQNAQQAIADNRGATAKTVEAIAQMLAAKTA